MSLQIFSLILQNVEKACSTNGVSYKDEKHADIIYYEWENRPIRDLTKLSELNGDSVREFLIKNRKGTLKAFISSEMRLTITFIKRTQQVVVKPTNEFGYRFSKAHK